MKKFTKALLAAGIISASVTAHADFSANVGGMSDYWFRGLDQTPSAGASIMGGLDYEHEAGFYAGTWLATLDDDTEYDLYAGWTNEIEGFSYGIGVTGYYYDKIDGDYEEVNLYAGYGPVSLEYSIGEYDDGAGTKSDYTFLALTAEYEGAYATVATFGDDFGGEYLEVGYGTTYEGIDMGIAAIFPDDDGSGIVDDHNRIVFTFSKTFAL
ncbi:MAG: TorF family putative porin [Motiliproteus sp.]|nr:TorF family putative porin [Motiliproteus sp.]MCW9051917.1 TorF family putative porin [Motiliproteus sp.]